MLQAADRTAPCSSCVISSGAKPPTCCTLPPWSGLWNLQQQEQVGRRRKGPCACNHSGEGSQQSAWRLRLQIDRLGTAQPAASLLALLPPAPGLRPPSTAAHLSDPGSLSRSNTATLPPGLSSPRSMRSVPVQWARGRPGRLDGRPPLCCAHACTSSCSSSSSNFKAARRQWVDQHCSTHPPATSAMWWKVMWDSARS